MATYELSRLLNDSLVTGCLTGFDRASECLSLTCDQAIPAECVGYVERLIHPSSSRAVQRDAARMLSRFVQFEREVPAA